jgi:hypothetical protein
MRLGDGEAQARVAVAVDVTALVLGARHHVERERMHCLPRVAKRPQVREMVRQVDRRLVAITRLVFDLEQRAGIGHVGSHTC